MSTTAQKRAYEELVIYMRKVTNHRLERTKKIKNHVENIVQRILHKPIILLYMMRLFFYDDCTLHHSLHVFFLSVLLGAEIELKEKQLLDLGKGAFLHDRNYQKNRRTNRKRGRLYPLYHHERTDGLGYPHHLRKKEIHLYKRMVGIADVFDTISSDRTHRKGKDFYTTKGSPPLYVCKKTKGFSRKNKDHPLS